MKSWKSKLAAFIAAVAAALGVSTYVPSTPAPEPTPTAQPTAAPTIPSPEPTVAPTASPSPLPPVPTAPPTPSVESFPVRFPVATVTLYMRNARYGNGVDSTPRIKGDRELCEQLHHVPVPNGDCHFDSDVWTSKLQRAEYEGLVLAGARDGFPLPAAPLGPVWEYKAGNEVGRCHDDQVHVNTSCDHFGSAYVDGRDDPKTPVFEGEPKFLAFQSDEYGPYAGWFMVPQTSGKDFGTLVRACLPLRPNDADTCAPWIAVDWK